VTQKNDGTGKCVLIADFCATGYKSDGKGDNCLACDVGYELDANKKCIKSIVTCKLT
jgi:hypothetical protein